MVNVQIKAAQAVMRADPDRAADALGKAQKLTEEGLQAIRQSIVALRESALGDRPLPDALAALVQETQAAGVVAELEVEGTPRPLDPKAELTLYRAAQEGLTNVRKHARASRVNLALDYTRPDRVGLLVADNGIGMEVENGRLPSISDGFGLLGIQERVKQLNGRVHIDSAPGKGFALQVVLPG